MLRVRISCPVSFDTEWYGCTIYTDGGGLLMLHDTKWNSIAWMRGITENDVGISYLLMWPLVQPATLLQISCLRH